MISMIEIKGFFQVFG